MPTKIRYSSLEYRRVLIVTGTLAPFDGSVPLDKVQRADLVVCVKGDAYVVMKDRYGEKAHAIDGGQFSDIRDNLPNVEIITAGTRGLGLFSRTE